MTKRLNIGCGTDAIDDWINLDASWGARLAKHPILRNILKRFNIITAAQLETLWRSDIFIHDVRKPLPFKDDFLSAIYTSHLLEHLYLEEAKQLLKECFRTLKNGGVLRVVVPDLKAIFLEYSGKKIFHDSLTNNNKINIADRLNMRLSMRNPNPPSGSIVFRIYATLKDFHSHKWMYDADSLIKYFELSGFANVKLMQFRKSRINGIEDVEKARRVLNGAGICVEGIKYSKDHA